MAANEEPEGCARDNYGHGAIQQLVRAIVPIGQSAATYSVLCAAARGAVEVTSVRADGLVYPADVLAILYKAIDAAIGYRITSDQHSCTNNSPPWFTGPWIDWHRGHGCDKDDGKLRTPEGDAEIKAAMDAPNEKKDVML